MQSGDRLVCVFVNQVPNGVEFKEWPLHVTIVPWFRADVYPDDLLAEIKANLSEVRAFDVHIGPEVTFGRAKTANLIQQPTPLDDIESAVRAVLKGHGAWLVDETTKKKRSYKPHVTAQSNVRLHEGESFWCDRLYIVEQMGGHKTVRVEIVI